MNGKEGLLVASKIADRVGITRSVIVNALRKLESAGVIESRSLGMKGTFIKVLNDKFWKNWKKLILIIVNSMDDEGCHNDNPFHFQHLTILTKILNLGFRPIKGNMKEF